MTATVPIVDVGTATSRGWCLSELGECKAGLMVMGFSPQQAEWIAFMTTELRELRIRVDLLEGAK